MSPDSIAIAGSTYQTYLSADKIVQQHDCIVQRYRLPPGQYSRGTQLLTRSATFPVYRRVRTSYLVGGHSITELAGRLMSTDGTKFWEEGPKNTLGTKKRPPRFYHEPRENYGMEVPRF